MTTSADLTLKVSDENYSSIQVLKCLYQAGWSFNDHGLKGYLPVGDNGSFNWCFEEISDEDLFLILERKHKINELIGVAMTWESSNIGGEFLFNTENSITINLSTNRQLFLENITDVNWYLERIIPFISEMKLKITNISFEEHV
ncbi:MULTISPECIES: hypothetical protein [Acinetobacter]|uniref:hypothetical protein n=1 Tax=Acinetobacter TaxID=469 RepID=UPI00141AA1D9|nr:MULTISPECIES: hypothetical protein [Acinetobacter]MCS4300231.1 hypothetical protein [Acinetobacter guillouiae]MCW2253630.1 hypothetical protein [Acinetobacter sp. BIGb0204]NII35729.1 hypothetical protein [Acinetobacter sp. BIGb0196]